MRLNDPKGDQFRGLKRFPRNLAAGSPLGYTSVSKGQTQFLGLLSLLVQGSGVVTGLWKVDGELRVGGTFNGSGTMNWTGPANISGNFEILSGGLFKAGNLTITPGGVITGASGLIINPNGILSVQGALNVTSTLAAGVSTLTGSLTNPSHATTTGSANMLMSTGGLIQRITSAARFKIDPTDAVLDELLLSVRMKTWIDLSSAERYAHMLEVAAERELTDAEKLDFADPYSFKRIPGVIAEEVLAAGGYDFVTFNEQGEVESVLYDRLAIARTQLLSDRLDATIRRVEKLEKKLSRTVDR